MRDIFGILNYLFPSWITWIGTVFKMRGLSFSPCPPLYLFADHLLFFWPEIRVAGPGCPKALKENIKTENYNVIVHCRKNEKCNKF